MKTGRLNENTYCSFLKCLFSTPVWLSYRSALATISSLNKTKARLTLIGRTAFARSCGFKNHAVVGESGNKNLQRVEARLHALYKRAHQKDTAVIKVMIPVMIMSLWRI